MKKTNFLPATIAVVGMLSLTGCAGSDLTNSMVRRNGSLTVENMEMLQRPLEYTVKEGKSVTSEASASWLFGFIPLTGHNVSLNAPIMGIGNSMSKSEAEALKKILDKNPDADGVMVTQSSVDKSGFPGIYTVEKSSIKGRLLSLICLGTLSKDEWHEVRKLRNEATGSKKGTWIMSP
jgi:hypothetical protein